MDAIKITGRARENTRSNYAQFPSKLNSREGCVAILISLHSRE